MGNSTWLSATYTSYATSVLGNGSKTVEEICNTSDLNPDMNPKVIQMRESRDSDSNPESTAIIIGLDVTGSMSCVIHPIINKLDTFVTELYKRKPITNPHLMFMGIGDVDCDYAPIQMTQFEADIKIAEQLQKIYIEGGGGGNSYESYTYAWYAALRKTAIDCYEKRTKKGYIFTIGDENPNPEIDIKSAKEFLNLKEDKAISSADLLTLVSEKYNVYHCVVVDGAYCKTNKAEVIKSWNNLLGQNTILIHDYTKIPEIIISRIQMNEGESLESVVASWDPSLSDDIKNSVIDFRS